MKYALCKTFLCSLQTIKSLNRNTFPRKCVIASHEFAASLCLRLHYHGKLFGSTIVGLLKPHRSSSITFKTIHDCTFYAFSAYKIESLGIR